MAKKTKAELVEEGKALDSDLSAAKKAPHNFALYVGTDSMYLVTDKLKSGDALRIKAKQAGGGSKGATGVITVNGKEITLTCGEGEEPPATLGKMFKRHLKERGLSYKVILSAFGGAILDAGDDDEPALEGPVAAPDTTGVDQVVQPVEAPTGIREKLEAAFEKLRPGLVEALKAAPGDYQPKLKTPALAYQTAMKAADYDAALKALGAMRQAVVGLPTAEQLTKSLADKGDPAKLAKLEGLLDNTLDRAAKEPAFDKTVKDSMREMRTALKAALKGAATPEDKKKLEAMKKKLDTQFLNYLKAEGHGPQRHEGDVTKPQLTDRAVNKFDPMTGTTVDGAHGGTHACGKNATRFKDPGDYVDAEEFIRTKTAAIKAAKDSAVLLARDKFEVVVPLKDALGDDYKTKLEGVTRLGSNKYPTGSEDTDFTGGTLICVYKFTPDPNGVMTLLTMYPEPL